MGPSRGGEFAGKWSISRVAARIIAELGYCERSFNTGAPGVVTEVKSRGMLWMMSAAWRNLPPGALWRAPRALLEGRSVARTNKFTLLDDVVRVSGVPRQRAGSATLVEGSASLGYMIPAANAATCLAQTKAPPKPEPNRRGLIRADRFAALFAAAARLWATVGLRLRFGQPTGSEFHVYKPLIHKHLQAA
jgi:hypothetical protein